MEVNDEVVERQKLVEVETEEDLTSAPKSAATPASPVAVPKIKIKNTSSGGTTRSHNSGACSVERTITSDKVGLNSSKISYINERKQRTQPQATVDERYEINARPRKVMKEETSLKMKQLAGTKRSEIIGSSNDDCIQPNQTEEISLAPGQHCTNNSNISTSSSLNYLKPLVATGNQMAKISTSHGPSRPHLSTFNTQINSDHFNRRPIKHHSFVSEVPDVKHMEQTLFCLLDDFHSSKLNAFGSGWTMDQMTKIREQQEALAKLHFELAASKEESLENGNDFNATKSQENMLKLMQSLEQLSISIEHLQTTYTGI